MDVEFHLSPEETACACEGKLPRMAVYGLELFNRGEYFEAHEALETAWREETGQVRELYRGILQVAVGYFHIQRGNYRGAMKMFFRARNWLSPFPDQCRGIQLGSLRQEAQAVEDALQRLGPGRIQHFDQSLFKPVRYSA
jgi:predicted metal-dependent hydrolase